MTLIPSHPKRVAVSIGHPVPALLHHFKPHLPAWWLMSSYRSVTALVWSVRGLHLRSCPGPLCAVNHTPDAHASVSDLSVAPLANLYNLT